MNPTKRQLAELKAELEKEYKKEPLGVEAFHWSLDHGTDWEWKECEALRKVCPMLLDLLDQIDRTLEPRWLLPLLNIPPEARPHFVDLFERLAFRRKRKRKPSYRGPTEHQQNLMRALDWVKRRRPGITQAQAIKEVAEIWGITKSALEQAVGGRHNSLNTYLRRRRG